LVAARIHPSIYSSNIVDWLSLNREVSQGYGWIITTVPILTPTRRMNASEYPTTKFTTGASLRWMTIEIPFLVRTVMDSTLSLCLSLDKICAVRAGWLERAVQEMKERPRRKSHSQANESALTGI
jgi:hypothetical protein